MPGKAIDYAETPADDEHKQSTPNAHQFFKRPKTTNPDKKHQEQVINQEVSSQKATCGEKSFEELAKIDYSDLTIEERFRLIKKNNNATKRYWKTFKTLQKSNPLLAAEYFIRAFELGHDEAHFLFKRSRKNQSTPCTLNQQPNLTPEKCVLWGIRYALALQVPQNNEIADFYFLQAAEMGNATGAYFLGCAYKEDDKDKESTDWYQIAAERGHVPTQLLMGSHLKHSNRSEAVHWYNLAAEGGNKIAQWHLGRAYKNGAGIKRNKKEALRWLLLAYEQGLERALDELKAFSSPLAKYIVCSDTHRTSSPNINQAAKLLLSEPELQQYLLNQELNHPYKKWGRLGQIILSFIAEAKAQSIDISIFLTELYIALYYKTALISSKQRSFTLLKNSVFNEINFSQAHDSQLYKLIELSIHQLQKNHKDNSDFALLKTLWFRAQSLNYQLEDQSLLRRIARLQLKALCNEAAAFKIAPVKGSHIDLLFAFLDANKSMSIDQLNSMLDITLLVPRDSSEAPVNLLNLLFKYVSNEEKWGAFKPFFMAVLHQYMNKELPFLKASSETRAIKILEGISQLSNDLKHQPQLGSFFNQARPNLETLCNLLIAMDTTGLVNFLNRVMPEIKQESQLEVGNLYLGSLNQNPMVLML